jgi:hypothetical protein
MKLSIYTCVKDGIKFDYHVRHMLEHHLDFVDEIVVNDGLSTDGTFEMMSSLHPKIKVFRSNWGKPSGFEWLSGFKNAAREKCTGDWCINIDIDEFVPEWQFEDIFRYLSRCEVDIVPLRQFNFYGNYKVYHPKPNLVPWPSVKWNMHRNDPSIKVVGDGSNVGYSESSIKGRDLDVLFDCHHFGFVRSPARLRQKWRNVLGDMYAKKFGGKVRGYNLPGFLFDLWPHDWLDKDFVDDLDLYDGRILKVVQDFPDEFVRDGFKTYEYLRSKFGHRLGD